MYEKLKRDGDYLLIYRHDTSRGEIDLFTSDAEARSVGGNPYTEAKFSVLNALEEFRREDGRFQFKLHYPEKNITNIWKQSNNFAADDVGQYITRGNLANGQAPVEHIYKTGTWDIIEKPNPGSSKWVVERSSISVKSQFRIDVPQERLSPNTTYTLSLWCAYENDADYEKSSLFYARWYDGDDNPIISDINEVGKAYEAKGSDLVIDGVRWQRRHFEITMPSTIKTIRKLYWYMGYSQSPAHSPTGKAWFTNFMVTDRPLIKNYIGDYEPTTGGVRDYEPIHIESTAQYWGGLEYNTRDESLADGSVDHNNWYYSIGSQRLSGGSTPGPGVTVNITELWIYAPIGVRIANNELQTRQLSECSFNDKRLTVRGVADGSNNSTQCMLNDQSLMPDDAKTTSKMNLFTFDKDGNPLVNNSYRLNNTAERGNFINALNAITDGYFVLASNGSCFSNSDIDAAISRFNPVEWRGEKYFSKYSYSYAAYGSSTLGVISDRCIFDHPSDGDSVIDVTFKDINALATSGFGKPIVETSGAPSTSSIQLADHDIVEDQYLIFKVRARKDESQTTSHSCNLRFYNAAGTEVGRQNAYINGYVLYEAHEYYVKVPPTASFISMWTNLTDENIDYVLVYKAGFSKPDDTQPLKTSTNGLATSRFSNSPIAGDPMNIDSWYSAYKSSSNLERDDKMPDRESGNVELGTLTIGPDESTIVEHTGDGAPTISLTNIDIDPTRPYYLSMWGRAKNKDAGTMELSMCVHDSDMNYLKVYDRNGLVNNQYIVIDEGTAQDINDDWVLYDAFILPHTWTLEQVGEFEDKFRNYFGVVNPEDVPDKLVSKGVGVYPRSNVTKFSKFPSNAAKLRLRFRETGSTSTCTSEWCLPIMSEVKVACYFEGDVRAMDLSMQ